MEEVSSAKVGLIGENYVLLKLAKIGINAIKLSSSFDFDLYTTNDLKIEVKTSRLREHKAHHVVKGKSYYYPTKVYMFHNYKNNKVKGKKVQSNRDRKCDFFVLVCLDDKLNTKKTYIIPKEDFKDRRIVAIYKSKMKSIWDEYLNRWDLLEGKGDVFIKLD